MKGDPLADVPPGEFVRARNALVKELRAAGKTAQARALAARRRPSPSVWAINQLARRAPAPLAALAAAGKALAAAQRAILGGEPPARMRDAERELRAAIAAALEQLDGLSAPARRRAADTLRAAALADDATRAALRAGVLEADLDPATGFEALGGVRLAAKPRAAKPAKPAPPDRRAREKAAREEARQRAARDRRLAKLRAAAAAAERRAREQRARLEAAEREAR
jgi:hypothetical protein